MPLGLFKQRLCAPQSLSGVTSALTCDVQVRRGEKFCKSEKGSFSNSGKMLQISKAVHRRGDGSSHRHSFRTKTCTASKIWPVENVDEVTRGERKETKLRKPGVWMNLLSKVTLLLSERCVKEKG